MVFKVKHAIVIDVKNKITENHRFNDGMISVCHAIIDYVCVGPSQKNHLTFADLYRISPKVDEETFYDAVFYLTRKNINVLIQDFEALDPQRGYIQVPDKNQIIEDMKNEEFINPFTGDLLTEEEFGQQVLTYFMPSPDFVSKLDA